MFQRKSCTITEVFLKHLSTVFFRKQFSNMPCVYILLIWRKKNLVEMTQYKHKGYLCLVTSYVFITLFIRLAQKCCCFTCKAFRWSSEQFSRSVILTATCMPVGVCRARQTEVKLLNLLPETKSAYLNVGKNNNNPPHNFINFRDNFTGLKLQLIA